MSSNQVSSANCSDNVEVALSLIPQQPESKQQPVIVPATVTVRPASYRKGSSVTITKIAWIFLIAIIIMGLIALIVLVILMPEPYLLLQSPAVSLDYQLLDNPPDQFQSWIDSDTLLVKRPNLFIHHITDNSYTSVPITTNACTDTNFKQTPTPDWEYFPAQRIVISICNIQIRGGRHRKLQHLVFTRLEDNVTVALKLAEDFSGPDSKDLVRVWSLAPTNSALVYARPSGLFFIGDIFDPAQLDQSNHIVVRANNQTNFEFVSTGFANSLYEEEIFEDDLAMWWSPEGRRLLFVVFSDSTIKNVDIPIYGNMDSLRARIFSFKMPIAGDESGGNHPTVRLFLFDVRIRQTFAVQTPPELTQTDHYVYHCSWINEDKFTCIWTLRDYTQSYWMQFHVADQRWIILYVYRPDQAWTRFFRPVVSAQPSQCINIVGVHTNTTQHSLNILSVKSPDRSADIPHAPRWMTENDFDADEILHAGGDDGFVLYSAAYPEPAQRNLLVHNLTSRQFHCLSCGDSRCLYSDFFVSPDARLVVRVCRGPQLMASSVHRIDYGNNSLIFLHNITMETANTTYASLPKVLVDKITLRKGMSDELEVYVQITFPLSFVDGTAYPVCWEVYGGPESHEVTYSRYKKSLCQFFLPTEVYVLIRVDGRGTVGRGDKFTSAIYKRLGVVEIQDQLDAMEMLSTRQYIDKQHILVVGWSYGGFVTGHMLADDSKGLITCGIIGAAVTDFRYYDTAYTERFLGLHSENRAAYERASLLRKVELLRNKTFLLIHGMADDNVFFYQAVQFREALQSARIRFQETIVKDMKHSPMLNAGIYGAQFAKKCLDID